MGQEIDDSEFTAADFSEFSRRLKLETELLGRWFDGSGLSQQDDVGGFELEAWLVDAEAQPAPINEVYLIHLNDELATPELARFNVEFNVPHEPLVGPFFHRVHQKLDSIWSRASSAAREIDAGLVMIGTLPTLQEQQLDSSYMSDMNRYRALNEQVLRQRQGRPIDLNIVGRERLSIQTESVMLESATTSFQIHLKVVPQRAVRFLNAAMVASAPMVAIAANSPYLYGKDLWAETRIPLFEQSVEVGGFDGASQGPMRRVSFGTGYVHDSLFECFKENQEHYPLLLPTLFDEPAEKLAHLRLHNGTIWRWTRPLIGFDDDGTPHLRIEHRVLPAGPSVIDCIANAAFFFGLVEFLASREIAPELQIPFATARDNFYSAARDGLQANITWLDSRNTTAQDVILYHLLPMARTGLEDLGIDSADRDLYLGIIESRAANGCNGASWQRAYVADHSADLTQLTRAYQAHQDSGAPVHEWSTD